MTSIIIIKINNGKQYLIIADRQHTFENSLLKKSKLKFFKNFIFTSCGSDNIINEIYTEIEDLNNTKDIKHIISNIFKEQWDTYSSYCDYDNPVDGMESIIVDYKNFEIHRINKLNKYKIENNFEIIGSGERHIGLIKNDFPESLFTFNFNQTNKKLFFENIIKLFNKISKLDPYTGNIFQFGLDICVIEKNKQPLNYQLKFKHELIEDLNNFIIEEKYVKKIKEITSTKETKKIKEPIKETIQNDYELLIIEDSNSQYIDIDNFIEQVKNNLIPELKVQRIDKEDSFATNIIESLDLEQLPIYIFNNSIAIREDWNDLENAFIKINIDDNEHYLLNPTFIPNKIMIKEPIILDESICFGDLNAPITIFSFVDFECPYSAIVWGNRELVNEFRKKEKDYIPPIPYIEKYIEKGLIKVICYNMPLLQLNPFAHYAHLAALSAAEQNKFGDFSTILWNRREEWMNRKNKIKIFKKYAKELKLNSNQFEKDMKSQKLKDRLQKEIELANHYGISATPTFLINKIFISGAQDFSIFKEIIESELEKMKNENK